MFEPVKVTEDLFWVGVVDWNVRDFHGYTTIRGSTYNSYLLLDEKKVLFDTVKAGFEEELLSRISKVIPPQEIDYLVINHIEPDHSGSFLKVVQTIKPEKIFLTRNGKLGIDAHFHTADFPFEVVKTGDKLNTGKYNLLFVETPMIHWPDSMVTYICENEVLISQDAFGQHLATTGRFDFEVDSCVLLQETTKYYANIVLPFSPQVQKLLTKVKELKISPQIICPDHGVIWKDKVEEVLKLYAKWSSYEGEKRVVIIYDTMWKSTELMAKAILTGVEKQGVEAKLFRVSISDWTELMAEVMEAKGIVLGSSTLNNNMLPTMAGFVTYMKGLRPRGKVGAAFGSFGWSGESVKHLTKVLEDMSSEVVHPGLKVKYVPRSEDLKKCEELGKLVAEKVKEA